MELVLHNASIYSVSKCCELNNVIEPDWPRRERERERERERSAKQLHAVDSGSHTDCVLYTLGTLC